MSDGPRNSYDLVPYESLAFAQTHPDRLATVARLFGLKPAPVPHCTVLELGCAAGGNLIPMAQDLPESRFVGIDLSARQIADGQAQVAELGLTNVELRPQSILDVGDGLGTFDYIICHGVYSWVPAAVREKVLDVCGRNLAPAGIAYISYNTYPGWHMRQMLRDMMGYHARSHADPMTCVRQARALLDFLAQATSQGKDAYAVLLRQELEIVRQQRDDYLYHDYLEDVNEPVYFHQFVEQAQGHGLQYLGEARLRVMVPGNFAPDVAQTLHRLAADQIKMEQYMDFVRNRTFRESLLCRRELEPSWQMTPEALRGLLAASAAPAR